MRITNDMLGQIREWISQDAIIVAKSKRLRELTAKRRAALEEYRKTGEALFWKTARAIKNVDWKLSLSDRRKEQGAAAVKNARTLRELYLAMRRKVRKMDTQIERTALLIGKRRGYLRYNFEQRFVLIAQRERIRMERKKGPFTATATTTNKHEHTKED